MESLVKPSGPGVFLEGFNYEFNVFSVHIRYLGFLFNFVTFKEFVNFI